MENTYENEIEINLRDIFYAWKRRIFIILAAGVLAGCISCCYITLFVTPLYSSTAVADFMSCHQTALMSCL